MHRRRELGPLLHTSYRAADKVVPNAVVKEPTIALSHYSFYKDYVGDLADFFPWFFGGEEGGVGTVKELARVAAVEDGDGGAIDELVVGAVVNEDDATVSEDGRRAGLDHAGVKHSRAAGEDGSSGGFGRGQVSCGPREAHLVGLVRLAGLAGGGAEPVHPILAVDFFGDDGAGLGPTFVPVSFVGWKDHAFAVPVNEIARGGEAKLGVFFVVAGVGEVVGVAEFLEARIFDAAVFFVVGFGGEDRIVAANEVEAVRAFGIAETGSARGLLGAVEHDEVAVMNIEVGMIGAVG